jgi:ABC-type nitrate/sulfonate/bicarbonate transport system ATPase subunit
MKIPKLSLDQLQYTYITPKKQDVPVLHNLSMHVGVGEFVSVIGPSGSGKSTLLQIIGGLITPTRGEVYMDGSVVTSQKGLISYMPQQPSLLPWRTVEDNVILVQELMGIPRKESIQLARKWLSRAGLSGYESCYPYQLSGGMQQRVSFLRALLSPQEMMCLDEPFASLDALTRADMQLWLTDIWQNDRRSVLFITHSIEEAIFLSDRIYVITDKPATVLNEIKVPFERPRQIEIQLDVSFLQLRQAIYENLKQG